MLPILNGDLKGNHDWLDRELSELGYFGTHLWQLRCVPGNGGDVSVLLPPDVQTRLESALSDLASCPVIGFENLQELSKIRSAQRPYYRAQGISPDLLSTAQLEPLHGRAVLVTVSGGKIWDLERRPSQHLCIISIDATSNRFKILFGQTRYGNVPTTELINHLIAHAANLKASFTNSAVIHIHPQDTIDLSRHPKAGDFKSFNQILYSQRPELLANVPELIGFVSYHAPGSQSLVANSIPAIQAHRVVMWQAHGALIREGSVERCVDLLEYMEISAKAALRNLGLDEVLCGLSINDLRTFVDAYGLRKDILNIFDPEQP